MKKFENFCKALDSLHKIESYEEPYGTVELTGMVGLYEICFEQAWKAMKEVMENGGYVDFRTGSPKQIIKGAYKCGLVNDEEIWLSALVDRNNVAHSYCEDVAKGIVRNTRERYIGMFEELKERIEREWRQ